MSRDYAKDHDKLSAGHFVAKLKFSPEYIYVCEEVGVKPEQPVQEFAFRLSLIVGLTEGHLSMDGLVSEIFQSIMEKQCEPISDQKKRRISFQYLKKFIRLMESDIPADLKYTECVKLIANWYKDYKHYKII